jgi:antitoxin VapB
MTLNIKDPIAHELARKLAEQTGESLTRAVTQALRERLERVSRAQTPESAADELLSIGRRCAATLKRKPVDHGTLLYDERGLPK